VVQPGAFDAGVIEDDPDDGCSVDLADMTTPKLSRVLWGMFRNKPAPGQPIGDYRDPEDFKLYRLCIQDALATGILKDAIHWPSAMNPAHALLRQIGKPSVLLKLREVALPHTECPNVTPVCNRVRPCHNAKKKAARKAMKKKK